MPDNQTAVANDADGPTRVRRCLPWQEGLWDELHGQQTAGRLGHALLLEGAPDTGRNAFAQALAGQLLCGQPSARGNCGECKSCTLLRGAVHSDFYHLAPEEEGKSIGIGTVRKALEFAARTPAMAQRKVLLCSPLESMTIAAFNAFLKCLEEPQGATVIILVLAQGQSIPATIRSRCQRYPLPIPSTAAARSWLHTALAGCADDMNMEAQDAAVDEYLRMAEDRPMLALRLMQDPQGSHARFAALLGGSRTGSAPDWLELERAGAALDGQELLEQLERAVQSWLRMQNVATLRSARGRRGFDALAEYAHWRNACRAGSNPSPELLRFRALRLYRGLWESSSKC